MKSEKTVSYKQTKDPKTEEWGRLGRSQLGCDDISGNATRQKSVMILHIPAALDCEAAANALVHEGTHSCQPDPKTLEGKLAHVFEAYKAETENHIQRKKTGTGI
jgi:hypothetical protein